MKKIVIGTQREHFDLDILLQTRLLIQANSGGGKSWLIRRTVEQLFGYVPVIIIDPEGEFATLREKFAFVLVGKGGETPADPRSAALLAEKLLEIGASAICDIYELKSHDRHRWVKNFLDAMINAPKNLWHPCAVVIDECHLFAPEKGQGESEAYTSVVDLATRGRKRGFCLIAATQRLGKLSKNVSAELQNVLIGSTFQDIDRKRAAETLGVPKSEERHFFDEIKLFMPGNFQALGRAISRERITLRVADIQTSHPQSGKIKNQVPPTPDKIKTLLPKLSDLPKEAEEKQKTEKELREEIKQLKKQIADRPAAEVKTVEKMVLKDHQIDRLETLQENFIKRLSNLKVDFDAHWNYIGAQIKDISEAVKSVKPTAKTASFITPGKPKPSLEKVVISSQPTGSKRVDVNGIGKCERAILTALAQRNQNSTKNQVAILAGYSVTSGSFNNSLSSLRTKGYISGGGDSMVITEMGVDALGDYEQLPTGTDLHEYWYRQLGKAEALILKVLIHAHPHELTKDEVSGNTGYSVTSGSFNNALSKLRTLELITGYQTIKASDSLFE